MFIFHGFLLHVFAVMLHTHKSFRFGKKLLNIHTIYQNADMNMNMNLRERNMKYEYANMNMNMLIWI